MHPDETLIQPEELHTLVSDLFQNTGMPSTDTDATAEVLVGTDLRGIFSHGTRLAPNYLKHILEGHMKAQPQPNIMFPAGGTRGYDLAVVAGLLTGAFSGGQVPSCRERYNATADSEHTFIAISTEHFVPHEQFLDEVDEMIAACHRTPPRDGFERVCLPGELEWEREQQWRENGIPLHRDHLTLLAEIADRLGVKVFW